MSKHKVKLSIAQHNRIFKARKVKFLTYYEIIDDPHNRDIEIYQYVRFPIRIVGFILSPLAILIGGVPAMIRLAKEFLSNKDVGADTVNKHWFYKQLQGGDQNHKKCIQVIESNVNRGGDQKGRSNNANS